VAIFLDARPIEKFGESLFIALSPHPWTVLTIYASCYVFPRKKVFFGGRVNTAPHIDCEIPQTPILGRE